MADGASVVGIAHLPFPQLNLSLDTSFTTSIHDDCLATRWPTEERASEVRLWTLLYWGTDDEDSLLFMVPKDILLLLFAIYYEKKKQVFLNRLRRNPWKGR
jgi:hypothetical protein